MPELVRMDEDTLTHYGVVGMKWGVRKERRLERSYKRASKNLTKAKKAMAKAYGHKYNRDQLTIAGFSPNTSRQVRQTAFELAGYHAKDVGRYNARAIKYVAKVVDELDQKQKLYMNSEKGSAYLEELLKQIPKNGVGA